MEFRDIVILFWMIAGPSYGTSQSVCLSKDLDLDLSRVVSGEVGEDRLGAEEAA